MRPYPGRVGLQLFNRHALVHRHPGRRPGQAHEVGPAQGAAALAGRPILSHVLDTAKQLQADAIHIVYGHGGEQVQKALAAEPVQWVLQAEQLGTGHAVAQAMPAIPDDHDVLILYGDVPLVRQPTLQTLLEQCNAKAMGVLDGRARRSDRLRPRRS